MTYKLFIDDERFPIDDSVICRSYDEAVNYIIENGIPYFISFDHDLGEEKTGYDFAKWFCDFCFDMDLTDFDYYVHSQNPIGRDNIVFYMENFLKREK